MDNTTGSSVHRRHGAIVWFTGMSGAGKSTLSEAVQEALRPHGPVEILDGDVVRRLFAPQLGFSKDDRIANVRRIGQMAIELAGKGVIAIAAAISPHRAVRDEIRHLAGQADIPFVEIFLNPSLETLIEKDVKGLYRRALKGEIPNFTGISDPYEPPLAPELELRTHAEPVGVSAERILSLLQARGILHRAA